MLLGRLIRFGIAGGCVSLLHIVVAVSLVESSMAGVAMANGTAVYHCRLDFVLD